MSSRYQKEKRLRPRNSPYKRDHFDQSRYLRVAVPKPVEELVVAESPEQNEELVEYDDVK